MSDTTITPPDKPNKLGYDQGLIMPSFEQAFGYAEALEKLLSYVEGEFGFAEEITFGNDDLYISDFRDDLKAFKEYIESTKTKGHSLRRDHEAFKEMTSILEIEGFVELEDYKKEKEIHFLKGKKEVYDMIEEINSDIDLFENLFQDLVEAVKREIDV